MGRMKDVDKKLGWILIQTKKHGSKKDDRLR